MLRFFKKKPLLDAETASWQLELLGWVIESFGGIKQLQETDLVLPTDAFFPPKEDGGEEKARRLFNRVKDLADMADWPCRLEALPDRAPHDVDIGLGQVFETPTFAGSFSIGEEDACDVVIRYKVGQVQQPLSLVAAFAHELAHYLMAFAPQLGPGGADLHEHARDALAVHMGFGVFMANSAFETTAWSDGLSSGHGYEQQGYLTEDELVYALALFMRVKAIPADAVTPFLKKRLADGLLHALKDLAVIDDVAAAAQAAWSRAQQMPDT